MSLFLGILAFFVILGVLVLVHELGHFTAAKLCGVRVEEFALGLPPRLKYWRRGGTIYSINALPLGGFVRMLGENGEHDSPDSFGAHAPWQRLLILFAGPAMNLGLAVIIFFLVFLQGSPRGLTIITQVSPQSPAARAGLLPGDRIVAVDGRHVRYFDDLEAAVQQHLGQRVQMEVQRNDRDFRTTLVPRLSPPRNQGPIGIVLDRTTTVAYTPGTALRQSIDEVGLMVTSIPQVISTVSHHGGSGVAGPIGIAHLTTKVVNNEPKQGLGSLFEFMALLSANLGVINLLPIPALDGGRIVFVLISWIRRRNLDPEVEGLIHMVGMAALLLLIVVVSYHDIVGWLTGSAF